MFAATSRACAATGGFVRKGLHPHRPRALVVSRAASTSSQVADVKRLKGIRMRPRTPEDDEKKVPPSVEYLVECVVVSPFVSVRGTPHLVAFQSTVIFTLHRIASHPPAHTQTLTRRWTDESPDTWESVRDVADNLLRDFETKWWTAVKKGDEATISEMMDGGAEVLARTLNPDRRSALHFASALGKADLVRRLIKAGAEVDLGDMEGYTPLHMASGYLHTSTIVALLEDGNADPEQVDRQGRSPLALVESLRAQLPPGDPQTTGRRLALEEVLKCLTDNLFEDVLPEAVLDCRDVMDDNGKTVGLKEYLIKFSDCDEGIWVPERYVSEEVAQDYDDGLEYAEAERIVDRRNKGDSRSYLVEFRDGSTSWAPEEWVSADLIHVYENGVVPDGVLP